MGQQSPVMPGNGNSQVNYQQRKSLKKTSSNETYNNIKNQQYQSNSRGNSLNSSVQE